jgi:protein TonB
METAALTVLIFIPYFYPASLPRQALATLLLAPPPPSAPAQLPRVPAVHDMSPALLSGLVVPTIIPRHLLNGDTEPAPPGTDIGFDNAGNGNERGALSLPEMPAAAPPIVVKPKPTGPVRVSAGVAEGHILVPIQPVYPAIARTAHVQGTVVIEAVISKQGLVEQARVISGPPLLAQAALDGVNRARYQPFKLNGDAIEVSTTINLIFTLGE